MENVLLVIHILTSIGLIGVVLLQRSEGGALGIGGGGGGGLMTGRGAASALTRTTMILGAVFFATSLTLATLATRGSQSEETLGDTAVEREAQDLPSDLLDNDITSDIVRDVTANDDLGAPSDLLEPEETPPASTPN